MPNSESNLPLFVDLDGTLIKTDVTFESLLLLIKKNLLFIAVIPLWLLKGRAYLKYQLAKRVDLPPEHLPYNEQFLSYLKREKANGRAMILISASNQQVVTKLNEHLKLFDSAIGSDKKKNLKSVNKLKHIEELNSGASFAYAGNSKADLPIWSKAGKVYMVNCGESLALKIPEKAGVITRFDMRGSIVKNFWWS